MSALHSPNIKCNDNEAKYGTTIEKQRLSHLAQVMIKKNSYT